jgi:hypothetical protein
MKKLADYYPSLRLSSSLFSSPADPWFANCNTITFREEAASATEAKFMRWHPEKRPPQCAWGQVLLNQQDGTHEFGLKRSLALESLFQVQHSLTTLVLRGSSLCFF